MRWKAKLNLQKAEACFDVAEAELFDGTRCKGREKRKQLQGKKEQKNKSQGKSYRWNPGEQMKTDKEKKDRQTYTRAQQFLAVKSNFLSLGV